MNDFGYGKRRESNDWHDNVRDEQREMENRNKNRDTGSVTLKRLDSIQDPGKRYALKDRIGVGICGDVYEGIDQQAGNKKIAIKIQKLTPETQSLIVEEYRILRDFAGHPNLPDFYGIYRRRSAKKSEYDEIWFVMELCEGGTVMDFVRGMIANNKRIQEEHIAFILREVIKALIHLHEHNVIHRDIRGSNIVLTKEGEVKLVDFGLSRTMKNELEKRHTYIGSPSWMAPEVIGNKDSGINSGYDNRVDVWAIGITAIELADGKAPFEDMHPTRALFQIVRNPPPTLYRPANWSKNLNDFISECLEKNPENRPYIMEIIEHPFLSELPENDYPLTQEIKALTMDLSEKGRKQRKAESIVRKGFLKTHQNEPPEQMLTEDLAALDILTEDIILNELHERLRRGEYHTFVGDVLLILNPNEEHDIYGIHHHAKYQCKSRSDNAPHIYSVADSAFQDVMLNEESQHILLAGESNSGKTTNMLHLVEHLMFLGKGLHDTGARVLRALKIIHAFTSAATPLNSNSTRCILQTQTTFGSTGKASGAIFWLYQLEKWRVSTRDRNQSNFHVFYYFYDGLEASENLKQYFLPSGRKLRYLRTIDKGTEKKRAFKVRNDPQNNAVKLEELKESFKFMDMEEHCETVWKILAAILILGEIRFTEGNNGEAELDNNEIANRVAKLLGLDSKKFIWALVNYCLIVKGSAIRKKHTCEEAREARDVLANILYQRLVDWIVNIINYKLSMTRSLYGDKHSISILDHFGFECFSVNKLEQLLVNTVNEQMQYYYNQRVFAWEMQEQEEEDIPIRRFHFYDNKEAIDQLMNKEDGLFRIIDDASRQLQDAQYILERIKEHKRGIYLKPVSSHEFTVAHYTGRLIYDAGEIAIKNRDFVPPEMIGTMRFSSHDAVKQMFTNKLTKAGSLTIVLDNCLAAKKTSKTKWSALMQESSKFRKYNSASRGQYSQTRKMRTCASTFRAASLEILKNLAVGAGNGGTHFVRCIRSDLEDAPRSFYREVVRQQIRALAVLDTAKARQRGYPYRIPFQEFLRRYKFLAFDFDETVDMTKDNCRLLLIRLKMEGWIIGKTKVFLKYYNEEYLSRLYETQVRKIIKVQCMMRAFLARKNIASKIKDIKKDIVKKASIEKDSFTEEQAALIIQKTYRGHIVRKEMGLKGEMSEETKDFIKFYCSRWRSKSMFQVLLRYRAARYQDFVQLSQQVHLYNQSIVGVLEKLNKNISLEKVDPNAKIDAYISEVRPPQVYKLPFNMQQELPYFDTNYMNDPSNANIKRAGSVSSTLSDDEHESWDAPLRRQTVPWANKNIHTRDIEVQTTNSPHHVLHRSSITGEQSLINIPFTRDSNVPIQCPPEESSRHHSISGFQSMNKRDSIQSSISYTLYSNNISVGSVRIRKEEPSPSVLLNQTQPLAMRNFNNYELDSQHRNNIEREFENRINRNVNNNIRVNPIKELEMIGRRNNNDENDDAPPFNFQAMLRKTPHQRASMKRNPVYESVTPSKSMSKSYSDLYDSNVAYKSDDSRKDSPEWNPNEMIVMSEKYANENAWNEEGAKDDNSVTTEIAPGIIVKGYIAEL